MAGGTLTFAPRLVRNLWEERIAVNETRRKRREIVLFRLVLDLLACHNGASPEGPSFPRPPFWQSRRGGTSAVLPQHALGSCFTAGDLHGKPLASELRLAVTE